LRPGGLFHLFLPLERQPFTIYAPLFRLGWKAKEEHCGHIQFYSDAICKDQLMQAGFEVTRRRWSIHPIYALVDVAYFTMLSLRGKPVSTSVEGFVHSHNGQPSLRQRFVSVLKDVLVMMGYYESRLLSWMPGGGGHFTGIKLGEEQALAGVGPRLTNRSGSANESRSHRMGDTEVDGWA
jgi:hypothetical protein